MIQVIQGDQIRVEVDLLHGARLSSVQWGGHEFSVQKRKSILHWGWYPLAPWGGRIPFGEIRDVKGEVIKLPTKFLPPHAIHGLAFDKEWSDKGNGVSRIALPDPYGGAEVEIRITTEGNHLNYEMEYFDNGCELPAWLGLHTWFPRHINDDVQDVEVFFDPEVMLSMDEDSITQSEHVSPIPPQPWDDVFFKPRSIPSVVWSGAAKIEIKSSHSWWIVNTKDDQGVCVEPQTAPPNAQNLGIDLSNADLLKVRFTFSEA